jgi:transposase IS66-like protein
MPGNSGYIVHSTPMDQDGVAPSFRRTSTCSTPPCSYRAGYNKGLPSQRMKRVVDREFLRRNPGTMSLLRIAAASAAIMLTLIQTAKLNDVDPQAWLADVLARIADHKITDLAALLPWNWRSAIPVNRAA